VVGIYEFQTQRLSPEFVKDFNVYTSDRKFGVEFLSTALPQMRTIPIAKSLHPQNAVSTFDEVTSLLQEAEGPFQIVECICRKKRTIEGAACEATRRQETCLAIGHMAAMAIRNGSGRKITRDEAITIIQLNQEEGLVLQPSNTAKAEFVCSCCGCCCGLLRMHKTLPIPLNFWATNYQARVDPKVCDGCRSCEQRCQVGAVAVSDAAQQAVVDLNKCIGCGLCVAACPTEALLLIKRSNEVTPPSTREDLYDIIMANKKGRLGKLKLSGRLFWDAFRTGQTHLLRSPQ
jgi:NAD-dependent dihydropyrimidine dehydrogenase PreA subunit